MILCRAFDGFREDDAMRNVVSEYAVQYWLAKADRWESIDPLVSTVYFDCARSVDDTLRQRNVAE